MKPVEWSRDSAVRYATRLLRYRDRSEKELSDKLSSRGVPPDLVRYALRFLRERGLVNDERLAIEMARTARQNRHLGSKGVRMYLLKRGIPPSLADEAAGADNDYADEARSLVEKLHAKCQGHADDAALRRIWGFLVRRGFSPDIIRRAIRDVTGRHV